MDALGISLVLVQLAKAYQLFDEATGDMSEEEKEELWRKTSARAKWARKTWEQA